ncbi:hypothetical protein D9613_002405 [Agrocybe pediades]|uniref:Uncharacterized protein n=1 Tax=Agrocybe pediades TaxID=84607 RepID=A0A8H4VVQ3_9AGAR|nr:hypothetical protein D9613_002405 [Agrocybe pediades]
MSKEASVQQSHKGETSKFYEKQGVDPEGGVDSVGEVSILRYEQSVDGFSYGGEKEPYQPGRAQDSSPARRFAIPLTFNIRIRRRAILLAIKTFPTSSRSTRNPHQYRQPLTVYLLVFVVLLSPLFLIATSLLYGGLPPSYRNVRLSERYFPQHDWSRTQPSPSGLTGAGRIMPAGETKYLRFPDHLWGHGLNNVLQEALLQGLIAHHANRSFVFEDFVWSHLPLPYTMYDFTLRPTRVPMSALLGGWLVGEGPGEDGAETTRSTGVFPNEREPDAGNGPAILSAPPDVPSNDRGKFYFPSSARTTTYPEPLPKRFRHGRPGHVTHYSRVIHQNRRLNSTSPPNLSISAEYFEHVCPPSVRVEVAYRWPVSSVAGDFPDATADSLDILSWWLRRLSEPDLINEKCVIIGEIERKVWDSDFFGTRRPLSLFPLLRDSPILRNFKWSSIVEKAVDRSLQQQFTNISTKNPIASFDSVSFVGHRVPAAPRPTSSSIVPGLLAVHLRRGDYKRHCTRLAAWQAGYMGWNRLVDGRDGRKTFEEELAGNMAMENGTSGTESNTQDTRKKLYLTHCLPTIPEVVRRLHQVRDEYGERLATLEDGKVTGTLRQVYVLTNGWPSFVKELRRALLDDGWESVIVSQDVEDGDGARYAGRARGASNGWYDRWKWENDEQERRGLSREERGVSVAIDMGIAQRAEVFVGNGFSSLSANVIMLRLAQGLAAYSNWLL